MHTLSVMMVLIGLALSTGCDLQQKYQKPQEICQAPRCPEGLQSRFLEQDVAPVNIFVDPANCDETNPTTADLARDEFCDLKNRQRDTDTNPATNDPCSGQDGNCQQFRLCKGVSRRDTINVTVTDCAPPAGSTPLPSGRQRCACMVRIAAGGDLSCGCRCRR